MSGSGEDPSDWPDNPRDVEPGRLYRRTDAFGRTVVVKVLDVRSGNDDGDGIIIQTREK